MGTIVKIDDGTPVEVKLDVDTKAALSLSIRINGGYWNALCQGVTMSTGSSKTWSAPIKDLLKA